jgi:hypothetical protein
MKGTRKHAMHQKKARAHAGKAHAHRSNATKSDSAPNSFVVQPDAEIIDDEMPSSRSESRVSDDSDEEVGIYGASRGEDAG